MRIVIKINVYLINYEFEICVWRAIFQFKKIYRWILLDFSLSIFDCDCVWLEFLGKVSIDRNGWTHFYQNCRQFCLLFIFCVCGSRRFSLRCCRFLKCWYKKFPKKPINMQNSVLVIEVEGVVSLVEEKTPINRFW